MPFNVTSPLLAAVLPIAVWIYDGSAGEFIGRRYGLDLKEALILFQGVTHLDGYRARILEDDGLPPIQT
jgi:hypothetical protein